MFNGNSICRFSFYFYYTTISRQEYAESSNAGANVECDPMIGGNRITIAGTLVSCTLGFKAKYQGNIGFVTAGHCFQNIGVDVGQPTMAQKAGKTVISTYDSFTNCDCAFIKITEDRGIDSKMFNDFDKFNVTSLGLTPQEGVTVISFGASSNFLKSGQILRRNAAIMNDEGYWITGLVEVEIIETLLGDSGSPVLNSSGKKLLGIATTALRSGATGKIIATYYQPQTRYNTKFGSSFSWEF